MKSPFIFGSIVLVLATGFAHGQWQSQTAPLMTRWAKDVSPDNVHREYPRPQMERPEWVNLNGLWDYAIAPKETNTQPEKYQGKILVPFPIESALSGVMKPVGAQNRLWYQRSFRLPETWKGQRILLHFGAVDWNATVFVNKKLVSTHTGGYDPFSFDITDKLVEGQNIVSVSVWDPTTDGYQPMGKQHARPNGIWYTPTTGIWQTVWIEAVPQNYIRSLKITPDIDKGEVAVIVDGVGTSEIQLAAMDGNQEVATATGPTGKFNLKIDDAKLWSPDSPHLYTLRVRAGKDEVTSYFGMRKIALGKDAQGVTRIMLNNQFVFQHGPLDQGFWPDGLYTAPTDEALKYDIEITKKLGFNMARKHVKVEPDRWYYWCDKLGLLVWQDMPSGDKHVAPGKGEITRSKESADNFERELRALIDTHYNHPCIVLWVPFNEGWGQYHTARITNLVKQLDPTRLADCASGWNDFPAGDVHDIHLYPGPGAPKPEENRAAVLGEYGGLGLPISGHLWKEKGNWGYRTFQDRDSLTDAYVFLTQNLRLLAASGLSAAVYTQTTDVEMEVNGLMTYDRAMIKPNEEKIMAAHKKLSLPAPRLITLIPVARDTPIDWRYVIEKPADNWTSPDFNDTWWTTATAGFGTEGTPGAVVGTEWKTPEIWIRKTFDLRVTAFNEPHLLIHHDEDAEVYINGQLVATAPGFTSDYVTIPLSEKGKAALRSGPNTIAIHCKQTTGGQYIDVGLIDLLKEK
ncbi:MAG TPA: glycoside hydrolase family 2 TIM barrel-domain containing protein [Tepidisphaeraceae bacterium]|jgi:hypothetical protein|nr:glycoside hydrolase family 2 TIM barrel-domain containing protein [Tepidisphaeraceae bacterium]